METVDVALCLAVDASASVDRREFDLMMGGLSAALRDPLVVAAATGGPRGAASLALLLWSGRVERALPWTRVSDSVSAEALAGAVDETPRLVPPGATALGEGLAAGLDLLAAHPGEAGRRVLDVSGDGAANAGRSPEGVRDAAVAAGVTVNALAVLDEEPDLLAYYEARVIGGPGAFAMACATYADFAEAIRRKLVRELRGALVS